MFYTDAMRRRPETRPAILADLTREGIDVWCWCEKCNHHAVVPTAELLARLGPGYPVPGLAARMRCSGCGSRDLHARPNWPSLGVIARHT